MNRPGWIARARAKRGIQHRHGYVGVGYRSGFTQVHLSRKELGHHGAVFGAPGSGKSTLLSLIVQGHSKIGPTIVLDAKGSRTMLESTAAAGGLVWTIGGHLKLDLLDPDPTVLAEQLTEAARHEGPAEVFGEAAARAIQWAGHILRWEGVTPTLDAIEALMDPTALAAALKRHARRPRVAIWQTELAAASVTELSGMATAMMRVTRLLDSAAGPSLGTGLDAARLEDVVQGKTTLLISLDSRRYPSLARVVGGWVLIAMQRAVMSVPKGASCLFIVDELGALGKQARHFEPLLARARDAGVGVIGAAHGLTQLETAVHGLGNQVLQETAWQIILAQGDPDDADALSRLFPLKQPHAEGGRVRDSVSLGKFASGTPSVMRDDLMWLATGECAYRVRPVDQLDGRWGMARIALPYVLELPLVVATVGGFEEQLVESEPFVVATTGATETTEVSDKRPEDEIKAIVYKDVIVEDGFRIWAGKLDDDGYPKALIPRPEGWVGKWKFYWLPAHRAIVGWEQGVIPARWEVDHECGLKRCLDHMKAKPKQANLQNKAARHRGEIPTGHEQYRKAEA